MLHHPHPPTGLIFEATEANFHEVVLEASRQTPIAVDFWADWCGPCHALTPVMERLVAECQGRWKLAKVEADENMRLAGRYKLRGFPTVLLFRDAEMIAHFSGAKPMPWARQFFQQHLGTAA
jgi:putative thioredoxin